jgi:hypothetical protein
MFVKESIIQKKYLIGIDKIHNKIIGKLTTNEEKELMSGGKRWQNFLSTFFRFDK